MSTSPHKPDSRAEGYAALIASRIQGYEDKYISDKFKFGSPQALYQRLAQSGFPICETCGKTPAPAKHCKKPEKRQSRRARQTSERKELPPANAARGIFRAVLVALEENIAKLENRKEWLQGERFVAGDYPTGKVVLRSRDANLPVDPPMETVIQERGEVAVPRGAGQAPAEPLTTLIGVAVLAGYQLPPLLRALHPNPSSVNEERLEQAVQEVRDKVRQLARLVRGGGIRRGPSTEELTPLELLAAWELTGFSQAGYSTQEIEERLRASGLSGEDIARLRNLRLDPDLRQ